MHRVVSSFFHRRVFGRFAPACTAAVLLAAPFAASPCSATTITFTESGVSAAGTPLLVSARLDTAADAGGPNNSLKITLRSFGPATVHPADVLTSFYFNLAEPGTGDRPTLTYVSGSGRAYEVRTTGTDAAVSWMPNLASGAGIWTTSGSAASNPSDLVATVKFNEGWQFKTFDPPPAYPALGFGIGTVGNSKIGSLVPGSTQTFDGPVVTGTAPGSMINLGIYSTGTGTDIAPVPGLDGARLVRTEAVFSFTSDKDLDSLTTTWVQGNVTFGFGTSPDSVLLPEPGSLSIAALGGVLAAAGWQMRRRKRLRPRGS